MLLLNRELIKKAGEEWTEEAIRVRTQAMVDVIVQIWPVPPNHRSGFVSDRPRVRKKISLVDLISAGVLESGMSLFPRRETLKDRIATLLPDGRIEVDDTIFSSLSQAAGHLTGTAINGWWFFLTDQASRRSLRIVRREYVNAMAVDVEDDDAEDDNDDE